MRLTPAGGSVRSDVSKTGWTLRTDDGGYRLQRCGGCGFSLSAAGPADSSMSAPWKFGWGAARSMGTGDYICVTLRGGAPWGFTLREGEGDTYRPLLVSQVCMRACVGGCFNTTWAGSCLSNLMLVRLQRWINSLMKVCGHVVVEILEKFLFLQSHDFFLRWEIQQENRKKQTLKSLKFDGRELSAAAFLCALAVFWWEIPRHPYMVKATTECEAQGSMICFQSQRLFKQESKSSNQTEEWRYMCITPRCYVLVWTKNKCG